MKKVIRAALVVLTLLPMISVKSAETVPPIFRKLAEGKPQNVVIYGTSLSKEGAWAPEVKKWFDQNYPGLVTFVNAAESGQNSDWGLKNVKQRVLPHKPDLLILEFSYNDAHRKFAMPVSRSAENLDQIVTAVREVNPDVTVLLQIMNVPWDAPGDRAPATERPELEKYNDNYRAYARQHQLPLTDHYPAWQKLLQSEPEKYHKLLPDGSHPSKEASLAVTWPAIEAWLNQARAAAAK